MNKYIQSQMAENNPDMRFCEGLDEALVGIVYRSGNNPTACYSIKKMMSILIKKMSEIESKNFIENKIKKSVGENDPVFLEDYS